VSGIIGRAYNILATQDLISWTVIGSVIVGTSGSSSFTDTNAASYLRRFYRAQDTQP